MLLGDWRTTTCSVAAKIAPDIKATHVGYVHFVYITCDLAVATHVTAHDLHVTPSNEFTEMLPTRTNLCQLQRRAFLFTWRHKREATQRLNLPFS